MIISECQVNPTRDGELVGISRLRKEDMQMGSRPNAITPVPTLGVTSMGRPVVRSNRELSATRSVKTCRHQAKWANALLASAMRCTPSRRFMAAPSLL